MKERQDLLLDLRLQVNQQVAATDQVQFREGRIADQVLLGKHHRLADLLVDPVGVLAFDKELPQTLRRDVRGDAFRVDAGPGERQGVLVDVGGEDLDLAGLVPGSQLFGQQDGDRVGFFPRGAAGHPDADGGGVRVVGVLVHAREHRRRRLQSLDQRRDRELLQRFPSLRIPEEIGDADQQVFVEGLDLVPVLPQNRDIRRHLLDMIQPHAALNAAGEGPFLVAAEVVLARARNNERMVVKSSGIFSTTVGGTTAPFTYQCRT